MQGKAHWLGGCPKVSRLRHPGVLLLRSCGDVGMEGKEAKGSSAGLAWGLGLVGSSESRRKVENWDWESQEPRVRVLGCEQDPSP